ncbi:VF530 family DNA-binding protein [Shewanella sp. SR44-3]|uniref:VF530 family protein n=1 Tax=unclassified Shewanella TaxID=196818 RepID=UPI0015F9FCFA|nr:VF530 family DNA-binding protein [Shewanella sp. SR44-3]MBB1270901.1 VF530 family DNA-binding protein [Shewanella sp. SR44-3]
MIEEQQNNPLHGLKLETMITDLVDCYGWKILYAALKLECLNLNPSIESCQKFLKKTEWAREKVENFYLYRFKRMPKANAEQYELKPRERGFAAGIMPRKPMVLTFESIAKMQAQAHAEFEAARAAKPKMNQSRGAGSRNQNRSSNSRSSGSASRKNSGFDNGTRESRARDRFDSDRENVKRDPSKPKPSTDPNNPWGK